MFNCRQYKGLPSYPMFSCRQCKGLPRYPMLSCRQCKGTFQCLNCRGVLVNRINGSLPPVSHFSCTDLASTSLPLNATTYISFSLSTFFISLSLSLSNSQSFLRPSVTSKMSPKVYKSCPKMISLEKLKIWTPLQKLPNNVRDLGKLSVAKSFKTLPKVQ